MLLTPGPTRPRRRSASSGPRRAVHAERGRRHGCRSTAIWNYTGHPAAAVPAGLSGQGCRVRCSSSGAPPTRRRSRARRAARARAPVGGRAPARLFVSDPPSCSRSRSRPPGRPGSSLLEYARAQTLRDQREEHADGPRQRGGPGVRAADPGAARASAAPRTATSGRRGASDRERAGWSWVVDPLDGTINFLYRDSAVVRSRSPCATRTGRSPARSRPQPRASCSRATGTASAHAQRGGRAATARARRPGRRPAAAMPLVGTSGACATTRRVPALAPGARSSARVWSGDPGCATSAASAAPRSICAGRRSGATTPTSSGRSSRGTSPRGR